MEIDSIVNKICEQSVSRREARNHMNEYLEISRILREKGAKDLEFQKKFSSFYVVRRDGDFKKEYFKIIAKGERDLQQILKRLYRINRKVEFSFATKVIHILDKNAPISDQNVHNVLGSEFEIECRVVVYEKLCEVYKQLLKNRQVQKKLEDIRDLLEPKLDRISDEKILDFLLWKAGGKKEV